MADPVCATGNRRHATQIRKSVLSYLRLRRETVARSDRRGSWRRRKGRVGGLASAAARMHDHRLGTREIEEAVQAHPGIAEVAVVGVADSVKGQVPVAFAVVKDPASIATAESIARMRKEVMETVNRQLGAIARPDKVHFVAMLPKTRSGKLLRRSIQAIAEGRAPGDITTIEDPAALEQIRQALAS